MDLDIEKELGNELTPKGNESNNNPSNQDNAPAGSNGVPQKFKLSDGREVTGDELLGEYNSLHTDYTKKTQRLSDLEKQRAGNQSDNDDKDNGTELSADDQEVVRILNRTFSHTDIAKKLALKDDLTKVGTQASNQAVASVELGKALRDLETDFNGSEERFVDANGTEQAVKRPKVTGKEVADWIRGEYERGSRPTLSPLQIARILHPEEFAVYDAARINGKSVRASLPATEKLGNAGGGNPTPPTPKYDFANDSVEKGLQEFFK